jgi:hypothetical protein
MNIAQDGQAMFSHRSVAGDRCHVVVQGEASSVSAIRDRARILGRLATKGAGLHGLLRIATVRR